jgi:hypothetical protein
MIKEKKDYQLMTAKEVAKLLHVSTAPSHRHRTAKSRLSH